MARNITSDVSRLWLPFEIIEDIIHHLWYSTELANTERVNVYCTLRLVNRTWSQILTRFARRDVHIPSPAFAADYMRILATEAEDQTCRSLTFRVEPSRGYKSDPDFINSRLNNNGENGNSISTLLYMIQGLGLLPNLRRVIVEYVNTNLNDLYDHGRLDSFPDQVTELEVRYTSTSKDCYDRITFPVINLPSITKLSVRGIPALQLPNFVGICPNVEELVIEDLTSSLPIQLTSKAPEYIEYFPGLEKASGTRIAIHLMLHSRAFLGGVLKRLHVTLRSKDTTTNRQENEDLRKLCEEFDTTLDFTSL